MKLQTKPVQGRQPIKVGDKFSQLTVVGPEFRVTNARTEHLRERRVLCRCRCGRQVTPLARKVLSGSVTSCGLGHGLETKLSAHRSHGATSPKPTKRLYGVWHSMRNRCKNPGNFHYARYGGSGATVCAEWDKDYAAFERWALLNGYQEREGICVIRLDANLPFGPSNCLLSTGRPRLLDIRPAGVFLSVNGAAL